ncbi:MAG TPA: hypothetical protein QGF58_25725 [Myxococcota bacterium]|nr:hypothetical protein [Myxococcota bacterium]
MRVSRLIPIVLVVGTSVLLEACTGCREDPVHLIDGEPEEPHDIGQYLSMDVMDGDPVVSYYDRTKGALAFSVGTIEDGTVSWEEERIDGYAGDDGLDPGDRGKYTSLAVDGSGTAWITYYDSTNGNLFYARRSGKDDWETGLADTGSGPTPDAGLFSSLQLRDDLPVVAHYDAGKGQLRIVHWNDNSWDSEVVDEGEPFVAEDTASGLEDKDADVGKYAELLIDGSSTYIAYYDAANGDLKLAVDSGAGWEITVVDEGSIDEDGLEADVGQWPSLLSSGGEIIIAYQDVTNQDLRIARGSGDTWTTELVDDGEWAGADGELFDNGSFPAIVYFDGEDNDVRLATSDGSAWTLDTLGGQEAGLGFHNETVTIGGTRYVACYDYTNRTIWFAKL